METFRTDGLKSQELVDNFLDVDEALQSYLVSISDPNVQHSPGQMQQQRAHFSYEPSLYTANHFAISHDQAYFNQQPPVDSKQSPAQPYGEATRSIQPTTTSRKQNRDIQIKQDPKHTQIQEKNRMAQKRFRERQKQKIAELHQQINNLESKVEQLTLENASLQSHNSLLEKVLAMRDEHIKLVQQQQMAEADADFAEQESDIHKKSSIDLTAIKGKEVKLSTEKLKKMTPEDVMQLWHTYVTEISSALVEFNSQTGGSTNRIEELIDEVSKVFMRLSVINPMIFKVWQAREYHCSELEELKRWQSALGQLDLSHDQKMELVQLRKLLLEQLQGLVDEKKSLHATIKTMLVTQTVSHKLALEYLKTNQTVMRLRDILRIENNTTLHFCSTIIRKILRPEQAAALMVHSYPQKPDLLALTSAIAMDFGEQITVTPERDSIDLPSLPDVLSTSSSVGRQFGGIGESFQSKNTSQL